MTHIDGSSCSDTNKTMPGRSKIAYYWREKCFKYFDYCMDWGEPSCWACDIWDANLDMELKDLKGFEIFRVWENHNYLQRCHILPKALGGCNCEANLVLLCCRCHRASPDSRDPVHFINWVRNKKKILFQEFKDVLTLLDYTVEEDDWKLLASKKFQLYYIGNSVSVGGLTPLSTYVACFIEFKKRTLK